MPQDDPTLKQWFTSLAFFAEPKSDLLLAVIVQAVEDASMPIKPAPQLPDPPSRPSGFDWAAWERHQNAYKAQVKNTKNRIRAAEKAQSHKKAARDWLMLDDSNFPRTAALLHIDADVIREALRKKHDWARYY